LTFDTDGDPFEQSVEIQQEQQNVQTADTKEDEGESSTALPQPLNVVPPKQDEYIWQWKVRFFYSHYIRYLAPLPIAGT
jgi:ribosome production factor 1